MQLFTNSSIVAILSLYVGIVKWPSMLKHQLFKSKCHRIFSFLFLSGINWWNLDSINLYAQKTKWKLLHQKIELCIYDHKRNILHLMVGFLISSSYDNHVFTNPKMRLTHEVYFLWWMLLKIFCIFVLNNMHPNI